MFSTCSVSSLVLMSARSVCRSGGAVVTRTVSATLPACSVKSTRIEELLARLIFSCVAFLNPLASTETLYVPGGRSGNV